MDEKRTIKLFVAQETMCASRIAYLTAMVSKILVMGSCLALLAGQCVSQNQFKANNQFDLTVAAGSRQGAIATSWSHLVGIGKGKKLFKAGYGLRFTSYFGSDQDFITAPARLTSRQTGPQVLFSPTYPESLDTVTFSRAQINSLNFALYFRFNILPKLSTEFNIDAVGLSFGAHQNGKLKSTLKPSSLNEDQGAKPTSWNVLLVSDNDIGSLNSEFLLRYSVSDRIALKLGFCFLFTEYTTNQKLIFDNDRYRNKVSMALVGISYKPFNPVKK